MLQSKEGTLRAFQVVTFNLAPSIFRIGNKCLNYFMSFFAFNLKHTQTHRETQRYSYTGKPVSEEFDYISYLTLVLFAFRNTFQYIPHISFDLLCCTLLIFFILLFLLIRRSFCEFDFFVCLLCERLLDCWCVLCVCACVDVWSLNLSARREPSKQKSNGEAHQWNRYDTYTNICCVRVTLAYLYTRSFARTQTKQTTHMYIVDDQWKRPIVQIVNRCCNRETETHKANMWIN